MDLSQLVKTTQKRKKRVGRGYGSGRGGHTSTRGAKGAKARGKVKLFFQGTKTKKSLLKRLPLLRGKGKLKAKEAPVVVKLEALNLFKKGEEVNLASLQAKGILPKTLPAGTAVKILGEGELKVGLTVSLPISSQAKTKIEAAGGRVAEGK
ncbi:MAG TPA: 50S ribosomal protein L15 [Clostridia bacterium]|nr:50S ribosomal protein L15 [Clostridia bacterium]